MERAHYLWFQIGNFVAFLIVLVMNFLIDKLPVNGVYTAQVSDSYPNLFTPSGYVFAIWGVIYLMALLFVAYQIRPSQMSSPYIGKIGWLYLGSALLNSSWLIVFHYSYGIPLLYLVSTALLVLLIVDLATIYRRLDIGGSEVPHREFKLAVHVPMSLYLGWISVATIAGIASAINAVIPGISVEIQSIVTAIMLFATLGLTLYMLWARRDLAFGAVVIWAVAGISLKQADNPIISIAALIVLAVAAFAVLIFPSVRRIRLLSYYTS